MVLKTLTLRLLFVLVLIGLWFAGLSQDLNDEKTSLMAAIDQLSATTAPGGGGADAYGEMLADDFSRWTVGSTTTVTKSNWVEGIREWFDDGWRVSDAGN